MKATLLLTAYGLALVLLLAGLARLLECLPPAPAALCAAVLTFGLLCMLGRGRRC